jgi:hypothetical protein
MTTNLLRPPSSALHTALGTWERYPYGVRYCPTCDTTDDYLARQALLRAASGMPSRRWHSLVTAHTLAAVSPKVGCT